MSALSRHCRRLRTVLLVLLMLGMVVNPTLAAVGDVHALQHAVAAASGQLPTDAPRHGHPHAPLVTDRHHHDHDHDHDHDQGRDGSDAEHAMGSHGLLHQCVSVSVTMPNAPLEMCGVMLAEPLLPEFSRLHPPADSPDQPFRPPIA